MRKRQNKALTIGMNSISLRQFQFCVVDHSIDFDFLEYFYRISKPVFPSDLEIFPQRHSETEMALYYLCAYFKRPEMNLITKNCAVSLFLSF